MSHSGPKVQAQVDWDRVAAELQAFRAAVGGPSYAEIARRVGERRVDQGADPHAARVARSTVFDAFRSGRARVNLAFVREIAAALGGDDELVDEWIASSSAAPLVPLAPAEEAPAPPPRSSTAQVVLVLALCVTTNFVGRALVDLLDVSFYLDMVGTAVAAVALGPWRGAAVGLATNVLGVLVSGPDSLAFIPVNVAGALVWGYGVHRFGLGRSLPRFFSLNVLTAVVCSLIAVPILVYGFGGSVGHGQDGIAGTVRDLTGLATLGVGVSNLLTSLGDKLVTGFLTLVAVSSIPLVARSTLRTTTLL